MTNYEIAQKIIFQEFEGTVFESEKIVNDAAQAFADGIDIGTWLPNFASDENRIRSPEASLQLHELFTRAHNKYSLMVKTMEDIHFSAV